MSYRSEEEQLELFKKWWQANGRSILVSLVVVLAGYGGWMQWQNNQHTNSEAASALYQQWLGAQENSGSAEDSEIISTLRADYADTFYGQAALLFLAREAVTEKNHEKAEAYLDELIKQKPSDDLAYTARLRSAKVLYNLEQYDAALARLKGSVPVGFQISFSEMRGDLYMAKNNADKARSAYEKTLELLESDSMQGAGSQGNGSQKETIEMKLNNAKGSL